MSEGNKGLRPIVPYIGEGGDHLDVRGLTRTRLAHARIAESTIG